MTALHRTTTAFAGAFLLALGAAAPADAAPEWTPGTIEQSSVPNCNLDPEAGIVANAEFQADAARLPRVGEVFYVRTIPGRVGNGCGMGMAVHLEIVPPAGVTTAVSPATPVRCTYMDIDTRALTPAANCPQQPVSGVHGAAFDAGGTAPWELAYGQALIVEVPLRSSRALAGLKPTCARNVGDFPCPVSQAGDSVQFADKVIDGGSSPWLSPYVPLFVQPAGAAATRVIASAPRSVTLGRLLRGLRVTVNVAHANSRVRAELALRGRGATSGARTVLVRRSLRARRAGALSVRLRPSRAAGRIARRTPRPFTATLRVRVVTAGGAVRTATVKVRVARR